MAKEQSANPFRPGNGVLPAYLAGRERPLAEFDAFVADPHPLHANWTVTGLRGTGKTVLVATAAGHAEAAGWLTLERELGERHREDVRLAEALRRREAMLRRCELAAGSNNLSRAGTSARPDQDLGRRRFDPAGPSPLLAEDRMRDALVRLSDASPAADSPVRFSFSTRRISSPTTAHVSAIRSPRSRRARCRPALG